MLLPLLALAALFQGAWQEVGRTGTGNPVYVHARTVKTSKDGIISAMVRVVYAKPAKVPGNKELSSSKAAAMFNCASNTFAVKESWIYLNEKTNTIYQHKVNKIPGYGVTIGGSFGDVALKHFCSKSAR